MGNWIQAGVCHFLNCHIGGCTGCCSCYYINSYIQPLMTIEEYNELRLQDELNIGYEVEEDLPDQYDEYDDESYVDGLLTTGFHEVYDPLDELFGEPIAGYSLQ